MSKDYYAMGFVENAKSVIKYFESYKEEAMELCSEEALGFAMENILAFGFVFRHIAMGGKRVELNEFVEALNNAIAKEDEEDEEGVEVPMGTLTH
jgi:phosphosulfolactate phosphohydrolase-like enzyme